MADGGGLSIGEVADRTGVPVPTLRAWEGRYGFPEPRRRPGGHRRYDEADCTQILQVLAERRSGRSLASAIERVRGAGGAPDPAAASVCAVLRDRPSAPTPSLLTRRAMVALSHAIEDESSSTGDRPVLVGSFQTDAAYRRAEHRWRDLAEGAEAAAVVAAFARLRRPRRGPVELRVPSGAPLRHEWAIACYGPGLTACLAGWERPTPPGTADGDRLFEAAWTVEPDTVRTAALVLLGTDPETPTDLVERARAALDRPVRPDAGGTDTAVRLANRMVAYATRTT